MDYKTSEAGDPPNKSHRNSSGWVDLQLPLYRYLLAAIPDARFHVKDISILLAYMALPKDVSCVGLLEADWSSSDLADADEAAKNVIRGIRRSEFFPPSDDGAERFPEFAASVKLEWMSTSSNRDIAHRIAVIHDKNQVIAAFSFLVSVSLISELDTKRYQNRPIGADKCAQGSSLVVGILSNVPPLNDPSRVTHREDPSRSQTDKVDGRKVLT